MSEQVPLLSLVWSYTHFWCHYHWHEDKSRICVYLIIHDSALSWIVSCCLCLYTPSGSRFPRMERWGLPTWAGLTQAAIRASLGIDLACRVQLEGSSLPVSSAVKQQNVCACHLVSRICCSVWIYAGESCCTVRAWVNNWWVENINKL